MASWFGSFSAGFSKGIVEQIAEKEKEQAAMTAASIKNMYHNVQEKKKEIAKQADEYRGIVSELGTFTFKDGAKFDDRQLITLASSPEIAKDIVKRLRDDTELSKRLTPDFFKAAANAPTGVKASEYMDQLFTVRAMAEDKTKALFNTVKEGGGIVDNLVAGNGYAKAQKAAAAYGMTLEQLVGYQDITTKRTPSMMGEMDYSQLTKTKGFEQVKGDLILQHAQTPEGPAKDKLADQLASLAKAAAMAEISKPVPEEQKRSKLADDAQDPTKTLAQRSQAAVLLQQRIKMMSNPKENNPDKVNATNYITSATRGFMETLNDLAPGKFIHTVGVNGEVVSNLAPKVVADDAVKLARAQAQNAVTSQYVGKDGKPRSDMDRVALLAIGVKFDEDGKAIKAVPKNVIAPPAAAPAEPAAPVPAPTAPVVPASTASGRTTPTSALPLPYTPQGQPDTSKLIAGKTYRSSTGGTRKWNGTNWEQQ